MVSRWLDFLQGSSGLSEAFSKRQVDQKLALYNFHYICFCQSSHSLSRFKGKKHSYYVSMMRTMEKFVNIFSHKQTLAPQTLGIQDKLCVTISVFLSQLFLVFLPRVMYLYAISPYYREHISRPSCKCIKTSITKLKVSR